MTHSEKYKADNVKLKLGEIEINGFAGGNYIAILPHIENPQFKKSEKEVTIELSLDFNYSHREWMEYYLGVWESNNDTENN